MAIKSLIIWEITTVNHQKFAQWFPNDRTDKKKMICISDKVFATKTNNVVFGAVKLSLLKDFHVACNLKMWLPSKINRH